MDDPGMKRYLRRIKVGRQDEDGTTSGGNEVRNRLFREGTRTRAVVAIFTVLALLLCGVVSLSGNLRLAQNADSGLALAPMAAPTAAAAAIDPFADVAKRATSDGAAANGQNYEMQGST